MKNIIIILLSILFVSCYVKNDERRISEYLDATEYECDIVYIRPDSAYVLNALDDFNMLKNKTDRSLDSIDALEFRFFKTDASVQSLREYVDKAMTIARNNNALYSDYVKRLNSKPEACYRVKYSVKMGASREYKEMFYVVKHMSDGSFSMCFRPVNSDYFLIGTDYVFDSSKCYIAIGDFIDRNWLYSVFILN